MSEDTHWPCGCRVSHWGSDTAKGSMTVLCDDHDYPGGSWSAEDWDRVISEAVANAKRNADVLEMPGVRPVSPPRRPR